MLVDQLYERKYGALHAQADQVFDWVHQYACDPEKCRAATWSERSDQFATDHPELAYPSPKSKLRLTNPYGPPNLCVQHWADKWLDEIDATMLKRTTYEGNYVELLTAAQHTGVGDAERMITLLTKAGISLRVEGRGCYSLFKCVGAGSWTDLRTTVLKFLSDEHKPFPVCQHLAGLLMVRNEVTDTEKLAVIVHCLETLNLHRDV